MDFPKKWLIVSFIAHVVILWASSFVFFGTEQPVSHIPVDFRYFTITEPEISPAVPPLPAAETPEKVKEEPEKVPSSSTAREKFKITPPPLPELPPDFMMVKEKVDSAAIKRENLKRIYIESMVVPYKMDMFALLDMPIPVPEIHLTREDSFNIAIARLFADMNIQNVGILNDIVADRYYSRYTNPVLPVDALLKTGISLASDLINKIFRRETTMGVDRFLTFDEINVMKLVWKLKSATPGQVYSLMPEHITLSMNDITIILEHLTGKGVLTKAPGNYEPVYSPAVSRLEIVIFYFNQYSIIMYIAESEGSYSDTHETLEKIEEKIMMLSTEEIKK